MLDANFWQDKTRSKLILKEKKLFEDLISSHDYSLKKIDELDDFYKLASEENNISVQKEIFQNIKDLRETVKKMKLNVFCPRKQTL